VEGRVAPPGVWGEAPISSSGRESVGAESALGDAALFRGDLAGLRAWHLRCWRDDGTPQRCKPRGMTMSRSLFTSLAVASFLVLTAAAANASEVCNGIDDDANGQIDEGGACETACGDVPGCEFTSFSGVTSGEQECAEVGRECLRAFSDGVLIDCDSAQVISNGFAVCGDLVLGSATSLSGSTTSGYGVCAGLGKECVGVYDLGEAVGCGESREFTNGFVLCEAPAPYQAVDITFSVTFAETSGTQECQLAMGMRCLAAYENGVRVHCDKPRTFAEGFALCQIPYHEYPAFTFQGALTSGNQECALDGRWCVRAYSEGRPISCDDALVSEYGTAVCALGTHGWGMSVSGVVDSGDQLCANEGVGCMMAFNDGEMVSCSETVSFGNGVVRCDWW